ncbi:MAG: FprA family A-type flavoprotein [Sedimentisphaerales bacterium]|nr:FprA family A-type flavoprotein [Sedimentisphaerales bacterium]
MKSVEIKPGIYWVGYVDWNIRNFHGYQTHRGTTYNAYLIVDEKIALIDSVKAGYGKNLLSLVSEIIDPAKIDYIISNHTEPDHSSELLKVAQAAPDAQVIATAKGAAGLKKYFKADWDIKEVKTGDSISLGKRSLQFISTPMLHWPDSMFTYVPEEKLLFSMDAFGQHLATSKRFNDEVDEKIIMEEARTYYANIIMHLGSIVKKTLKAAEGLEIDMIAPSHGVIFRNNLDKIISKYIDWSSFKPKPVMLVIYDTMWQSTEMMATAITDGAIEAGIEVKKLSVQSNDITTLATEILEAGAVAVGSPTLNNGLLPTVAEFLTYIKGLRPGNKLGFAFGSHGWAGGAVPQIEEVLRELGTDLTVEGITCQYRPNDEELAKCKAAGKELAEKLMAKITAE